MLDPSIKEMSNSWNRMQFFNGTSSRLCDSKQGWIPPHCLRPLEGLGWREGRFPIQCWKIWRWLVCIEVQSVNWKLDVRCAATTAFTWRSPTGDLKWRQRWPRSQVLRWVKDRTTPFAMMLKDFWLSSVAGYWQKFRWSTVFFSGWHQLVQSVHGIQRCFYAPVSFSHFPSVIFATIFNYLHKVCQSLYFEQLFLGMERSLSASKEQERLEQLHR